MVLILLRSWTRASTFASSAKHPERAPAPSRARPRRSKSAPPPPRARPPPAVRAPAARVPARRAQPRGRGRCLGDARAFPGRRACATPGSQSEGGARIQTAGRQRRRERREEARSLRGGGCGPGGGASVRARVGWVDSSGVREGRGPPGTGARVSKGGGPGFSREGQGRDRAAPSPPRTPRRASSGRVAAGRRGGRCEPTPGSGHPFPPVSRGVPPPLPRPRAVVLLVNSSRFSAAGQVLGFFLLLYLLPYQEIFKRLPAFS